MNQIEKQLKVMDIDPLRKEMFLRCLEGHPNAYLAPFLTFLNQFRYCDRMLKWLISENLTGENLVRFLHEKGYKPNGKGSLKIVQWIVQQVNLESQPKPVLVGPDYLPRK